MLLLPVTFCDRPDHPEHFAQVAVKALTAHGAILERAMIEDAIEEPDWLLCPLSATMPLAAESV